MREAPPPRCRSATLVLAFVAAACAAPQSPPAAFRIEETTIADVHSALRSGRLTCRALVASYLQRISEYDRELTAIVTVNERALALADSLDRVARDGTARGPLHCVPFVVKDNIATAGIRTTVGSAAYANLVPHRDAFVVQRLRAAGAIVLAKGHLAEFAISYARTAGSILEGETRNPYALEYTPAGSSGGVAAAVGANLALAGLASETGKSIRGPSAYTALVGLRATAGLASTSGVAPLRASVTGPMTRTVADLAHVLDVIAVPDPEDHASVAAPLRAPGHSYTNALDAGSLRGTRIGVARQVGEGFRPDPEALVLFEAALRDLRNGGAVLVDSLPFDSVLNHGYLPPSPPNRFRDCQGLRFDLDAWLDDYAGPAAPRLPEILREHSPSNRAFLERAAAVTVHPRDNPVCAPTAYGDSVRAALLRVMDGARIAAVVYPTWVTAPARVGGGAVEDTEMLSLLPGAAGFPAITVPMGYLQGRVPLGLEFFARPWQEETLIGLAGAYERLTRHRRKPALENGPPIITTRE